MRNRHLVSPRLFVFGRVALAVAALASPPAQALTTFTTSAGYSFDGSGSFAATGQGAQQISFGFSDSQSIGSVTANIGADATIRTSGNLFLNVDASFSGSQASLSYSGSSVTTVTQLGGGRYALKLDAAPVSRSFSDSGATAAFSINGGLALAASASGRLCAGGCTSGSTTILNNDYRFNLLGASNAGKGSISVLGQPLPLVTLNQQQSLSFAGLGAPYLTFTLNSVGGTSVGTTSASSTSPVFTGNLDVIRLMTTATGVPSSFKLNMGGIGSVSYNIGSAGATVNLSLTRNDTSQLSFNQQVSFVDRRTGELVAVPVNYTTDAYTFKPNGNFRDRELGISVPCTRDYSGADSRSVTFLTGGAGGLTSPGPLSCFTHTTTNFSRAQASVTGTTGSVAVQVGDGSFDFSRVKVVSSTDIAGQVASERSLGVAGGAFLSLGAGSVNIKGIGGGGFGPVVKQEITAPIASKSLGTATVSFNTLRVANAIGFDGATNRQAAVDVAGNGTIDFFGNRLPLLALGPVRVGQAASGLLTITNSAADDGFSEALLLSGSGALGAAQVGTLSASKLAPGQVATLAVSVDTARAGAQSGLVGFDAASDGTLVNGNEAQPLARQTAVVTAQVYAPAVASVGARSLHLGVARVGDTVTRQVGIANTAEGELTDSLVTRVRALPTGFSVAATPGPLAQGQAGQLVVELDTRRAGQFSGDALLAFNSHNEVLSELALDDQSLTLTGTVNNHAVASFSQHGAPLAYDQGLGGYVLDIGTVAEGMAFTLDDLVLRNAADGPADKLSGRLSLVPGGFFSLAQPFTVGPLAAGEVSGRFTLHADTRLAGQYRSELVFDGVGTNASDPTGEALHASLFLTGQVVAVPEPASTSLFALGALGLFARLRLRRRVQA